MKINPQLMILIAKYIILSNSNKTYAELAEETTRKFHLPKPFRQDQVRKILLDFKQYAYTKIKHLISNNQCLEAKRISDRLAELVPDRKRGRRRLTQTCTVNL